MSILPSWLRPPPPAGGSSLVRSGRLLSSTSTRPARGWRPGASIARRSLAASIQAVRYEPKPSCACSCSAEMPLECVAIRKAASNQIVSGSLLACSTVPAVREQPARASLLAAEPSLEIDQRTRELLHRGHPLCVQNTNIVAACRAHVINMSRSRSHCLLYTSDAADDLL